MQDVKYIWYDMTYRQLRDILKDGIYIHINVYNMQDVKYIWYDMTYRQLRDFLKDGIYIHINVY